MLTIKTPKWRQLTLFQVVVKILYVNVFKVKNKDGRKIHVDQATSDFIADLEHKLVTNLNVIMH